MRTPDRWDQARATVIIAVVTFFAWLAIDLFGFAEWATLNGGFAPLFWTSTEFLPRALLTPLSATLIHSGFLHVALNLVMLLICGRAVEGAVGPANLLVLYVVGAYAAAAGQFAVDPGSNMLMVGASGAISAVIGAYAMLFGKNKVRIANPTAALWLNTLWLLAAWVGLQLVSGIALGMQGVLVAIGAHIGGFVAGLILARPLLLYRYRNA